MSQFLRKTLVRLGLPAVVVTAAVYWYAHRIERVRVSLERATVEVDKPGLPQTGLTILHLSDFHFRAEDGVQAARLARLRSLLAHERFDILALTGDLIHNEAGFPSALAFLRELRPALGAFSVPGNRDYWESSFKAVLGTAEERAGLPMAGRARLVLGRVRRMLGTFAGNERAALRFHGNDIGAMNAALRAQGIAPLVNQAARLHGPGFDLWFAGVDDWTQGKPDLTEALSRVPPGAVLVLLAHNPDAWLSPAPAEAGGTKSPAHRADLVLSGHTHGGQLNLPVLGAWYRQGTRVSRHKAAGWFIDGASRMFVSRGLGESFPFRVGAPPQAALIRLVPAAGSQKAGSIEEAKG